MKGLIEGRIVHFVLTQGTADEINRRRVDWHDRQDLPEGPQIHVGNHVDEGEHCPMMVVKVWDHDLENGNGCCNGQVLLDGNDSFWVTSIIYDDNKTPGSWHWIEPA